MMTAEQLKASILQMAMQGKLVEQRAEEGTGVELYSEIQKVKNSLLKSRTIRKDKNLTEISDDDIPFDIPESWIWVKLGDISNYAQAKRKISPSEIQPSMWSLDLEDIEKGTGKIIARVSAQDRKIQGDKVLFEKGNILYSKLRPYLLKILIADGDGITTPELIPFNVYGNFDQVFFLWYLRSPYVDAMVNSVSYGVKMPRVGTDTMVNLLVPLPPLEEQKRIVAKIEELMPFVEQYAKESTRLNTLNASFHEQVKKSILQQAVMGKLVPQDPNDEPASVLLKKIAEEKQKLIKEGKIKKQKALPAITEDEIPFDIPESWEWVRLECVTKSITDGDHQAPPQTETGIPFLVISNVSSGFMDFSNTRHVPKEYFEKLSADRKAVKGDILFTVTGSYGIPMKVETEQEFCFQRHIALIKPMIDANFLVMLLKSPLVKDQCDRVATGTAQKTVGLGSLRNILVPIPPKNEQIRILETLKYIIPLAENLN